MHPATARHNSENTYVIGAKSHASRAVSPLPTLSAALSFDLSLWLVHRRTKSRGQKATCIFLVIPCLITFVAIHCYLPQRLSSITITTITREPVREFRRPGVTVCCCYSLVRSYRSNYLIPLCRWITQSICAVWTADPPTLATLPTRRSLHSLFTHSRQAGGRI